MKRDLLRLVDLTRDECSALLALATEIKTALRARTPRALLAGKTLAMIFEKPSLRTRVSFETGMFQLGGHAIYLAPWDIRLGERETVADVARNLARVVDMIVARTFSHAVLGELAQHARVPVINGLTDLHHPCQVLADLFTLVEHRRKLDEIRVAFIGDGNNLVHSWMEAATLFRFTFAVACPEGYEPDAELLADCRARGARIDVTRSVTDAVGGADVLYTDVWTSMGQEDEAAERRARFAGYQINDEVLRHAAKDALVMHCLPAHRGEEITDAVIEGRQSIIFDQAENRLHLQKALMAWLARESGT
ncbi:MAG: ornithine carbamoyltransferase [Deltaproteobacteria bacterium]|nr:ornithine carbamoyltransferase [Deltaproteobacteria bacterium]